MRIAEEGHVRQTALIVISPITPCIYRVQRFWGLHHHLYHALHLDSHRLTGP